MKIQFLNGGLANQAFQYIFARHYELSHPGEIMYLDDSYFALALKACFYLDQNAKKWNIVVFSDDIEWCKENQDKMGLDKFGNTIFIEGNIEGKNYIDLQLMSMCEGAILSKSAFSYLAALLNTSATFLN